MALFLVMSGGLRLFPILDGAPARDLIYVKPARLAVHRRSSGSTASTGTTRVIVLM
jgi:hypothetical protein